MSMAVFALGSNDSVGCDVGRITRGEAHSVRVQARRIAAVASMGRRARATNMTVEMQVRWTDHVHPRQVHVAQGPCAMNTGARRTPTCDDPSPLATTETLFQYVDRECAVTHVYDFADICLSLIHI